MKSKFYKVNIQVRREDECFPCSDSYYDEWFHDVWTAINFIDPNKCMFLHSESLIKYI